MLMKLTPGDEMSTFFFKGEAGGVNGDLISN